MYLVMTDPYHDNNLIIGLYATEEEARQRAEVAWADQDRRAPDEVGIWAMEFGDYEYPHPYSNPPLAFNGKAWNPYE